MANLFADGVEINIEEGKWRLYNTAGANSLSPFFYVIRGTRLLNYVSRFGEARGLPGDVMAADYVQAVVVGFDEKIKRWRLGIQVVFKEGEKPRFIELVHWPEGEDEQYAVDSHRAGHVLAEYIGCPLKLFNVKKVTTAVQAEGRATKSSTGPLMPRQQIDLDLHRVRLRAERIGLPISQGGVAISSIRNGISIRIPKSADAPQPGEEIPVYNQCIVNKDTHTVRLMPPSLLGGFLGPAGRTIPFDAIKNVELRHSVIQKTQVEKDDGGLAVDLTQSSHLYAIYLTLNEEALLLTQMRHTPKSEIAQHRVKVKTLTDGDYNVEQQMAYLRLQQQEQQQHDKLAEFMESAAFVIAAAVDRPLVKSDLDDLH